MDDVVLEVRKARDEYAERFAFDLLAIHNDLKEQEKAGGRRVVSLPPRRSNPAARHGTRPRRAPVPARTDS